MNRDERFKGFVSAAGIITHILQDDGVFPNNARRPLLVYRSALSLPDRDPASIVEALFAANRWGGAWRNGVYGFHHYHSTAHEVLGVYGGRAEIQLGGDRGVVVLVQRGDVLVIPAGVAHKNLSPEAGLRVVGAYPAGTAPDMNYGNPAERPLADGNIERTPLPQADPVYGPDGPLSIHWGRPEQQ